MSDLTQQLESIFSLIRLSSTLDIQAFVLILRHAVMTDCNNTLKQTDFLLLNWIFRQTLKCKFKFHLVPETKSDSLAGVVLHQG